LRGEGSDVASAVGAVVILLQKTREFVPIEPPPACPQAGQKFEFADRKNRHLSIYRAESGMHEAAEALQVWGIAALLMAIRYR